VSNGIPVLAAFHATASTWEVWCEHCHAWHTHGAANGHRVQHCAQTTPAWSSGYYLSDHHPHANIKSRGQRPRLAPLAWHLALPEAAA
jgi:hypothetical protein